jgi:anti-anti-sigma factor
MAITVSRTQGVLVVALSGSLDAPGADAAERAFQAALTETDKYAVLDLQALEFTGSAGLRLLVLWDKTLKARSGQLLVAGTQPSVRGILNASGLSLRLSLHASIDEALAAILKT